MILDADVTKAQQKIKGLTDTGTIGSGAPASGPAPATVGQQPTATPSPAAPNPISAAGGSGYFDHLAERSYHAIAARVGQARRPSDFRELTDRMERALYNANQGGNKDLVTRLTSLADEIKRLEEQFRRQHAAGQAAQAGAGGAGNGGGSGPTPAGPPGNNWARQAGQWLQGQGANSVLGGLTRNLGGPVGSALFAGAGRFLTGPLGIGLGGLSAANWAFNAVSNNIQEANAPARNEITGYADLARQYGSNQNFMRLFRDPMGWTNSRFARSGYSATQAAHVAAVYDRPGGMLNDTESILQFARSTGTEESRAAAVAAQIGRAGVGGIKGGSADETLRILKLAMRDGLKDGIAQSETLNSLNGAVQRNTSSGYSTNRDSLAYLASIQGWLNAALKPGSGIYTSSQVMRGEQGLQAMQGMMNGIGDGGGDPGIKFALTSSLINRGLKSASDLGMTTKGADGKAYMTGEGAYYDQLRKESPVAAAEYLMKRAGSGKDTDTMAFLASKVDQLSGGSSYLKDLLYQQLNPSMSAEQRADLIGNGGVRAALGKNAPGSTFNPADPDRMDRMRNGESLTTDVQGNNKTANQNMWLRVAEQDREMLKSISSLNLTGGLEGVLGGFKNELANWRMMFTKLFGDGVMSQGNMAGQIGGGDQWSNPSNYRPLSTNTTAVNGKTVQTVGQPAIGSGVQGGAQASSRLLSAIAMTESTNGLNPNTNLPGKSAVGLFQMQSKWLPPQANGDQGWAAAAGVRMSNPDGSRVTTEAQARAWQVANPTDANRIAVSRLGNLESQIRAQAKKDGVTLRDDQVAGYAGLIWHSNGGANLSPILKGGKIITDPRLLSRTDQGDGVSNYSYYNNVIGAYSNPNLSEARTGFGTGPGGTRQGNTISGEAALGAALGLSGKGGGTAFGNVYKGHPEWGIHVGEDLFAKQGTKVFAPFSGYVQLRPDAQGNAQGNVVDLFDKSNQRLSMIHLQKYADGLAEAVKKNKGRLFVERGDLLGFVGRTGSSAHATTDGSNDHLHITAVNSRGKIVDPYQTEYTSVPTPKGYVKGYRTGGYTGDHHRDEVAGVVHGQEFVMTAEATRRYRPVLESMNSGGGGSGGAATVTVNFGGTVQVNATISQEAQQALQQEHTAFQRRAAGIVTMDIRNSRGVRGERS